MRQLAALVLADGTVFEGEAMGALGAGPDGAVPKSMATGEIVFNTCLSGYQEVLTDPSYAGQVITFTYPHIGNYGVSPEDEESVRPFCRGVVVRDVTDRPSSWRSAESLEHFLTRHGVAGMTGVDTRRLTRHIREAGAMPCAFGTAPESVLREAARAERGTEGVDLVAEVTTRGSYRAAPPGPAASPRPPASPRAGGAGGSAAGQLEVVAYDFGLKRAILRNLTGIADVEVVPATTTAGAVLERRPDGVFLSNGPGDPAALGHLVAEIRELVGKVPIFGICLGHQLLASAVGAKTFKMGFGHHGGNHPVMRLATGKVEITSQNHGYAVAEGSLGGAELTHVNLNDGVVEGLSYGSERAFSVQYHPEAGPGPHDARYLFEQFRLLMEASR